MADRPNFFDLLELDPGETRREVIEKRLQEKKTLWARDSTMGSQKKRQEARQSLDLLSKLQEASRIRRCGAERQRTPCAGGPTGVRPARPSSPTGWRCSKAPAPVARSNSQRSANNSRTRSRPRSCAQSSRPPASKWAPPPSSPSRRGLAPNRSSRPTSGATSSCSSWRASMSSSAARRARRPRRCVPEPKKSTKPASGWAVRMPRLRPATTWRGSRRPSSRARRTRRNTIRIGCWKPSKRSKIRFRRPVPTGFSPRRSSTLSCVSPRNAAQLQRGLAKSSRSEPPRRGWRIVPSAKAPPPPRDSPTQRGEAGAREKPGPAGSGVPSRRRMSRTARGAAAGATLLLALSTAALVWGPPPFDLLAGWLPPGSAPRQTHRTKRPVPPQPTRQPAGAQSLSSGPPTATTSPTPPAPPPASGTKPKAAEPTAALPQSPSPSLPPVAAPAPAKRGTPKNAAGSNSGGSGSAPAVLAASAKLPPQRQIPPPPVLLPSSPEVAVVAVGDTLLASPLEAELERAFRSEGLGIISGSPSIDSLRQSRGGNPSISEILGSLRGDGVRAVVIAQVDRLGSRELSFYGRKDVSSTSRVHIQVYLVDGRRSISSWSEQIEYTAASAATEGETAAHRAAPSLASSVRSAWESLRATP